WARAGVAAARRTRIRLRARAMAVLLSLVRRGATKSTAPRGLDLDGVAGLQPDGKAARQLLYRARRRNPTLPARVGGLAAEKALRRMVPAGGEQPGLQGLEEADATD